MGFENKIIRMVGNLPKIDKMIRKTYAADPEPYQNWHKFLTEEIIKLSDNYNKEDLIKLITEHPYVAKHIKKEDQSVVQELLEQSDTIAKKEIFFNQHLSKFENHTYVLLVANNEDEYGMSHALYCDDLLSTSTDMDLKQLRWFFECLGGYNKFSPHVEIQKNEQLTQYIEENEKFPQWLYQLDFLEVPLKTSQAKRNTVK